ncbi:ParB/Sulfiredoxin [uncultured Caudovirales phage]|uniref:ParB/Sulfiredoxin n=1 Tax=uncultured Caudovirales phage TaxID=2100421 RepID=A0A6J5KJC9_9CAUD|nr:ParB/Sulfiredoxin [uncultured Caudovirales phage]CAB4126933.1 ParB/Sulfiredoxin [uncultured Caudovirales phage]CAB4132505.1 ParB/Sulfiredoxin [uncultured Caudovirales phage]CAB4146396.1 ParB/Sulfiredoxin [uncultured Caudovirales phage]CAB4200287.1 ParB/Sulfiredoxin [uncultured Caudovirales phage]
MKDLTWTTQQRKLSVLKEFEHNPRQITENDFERLKKSLNEFGYVEIIAIDTDNTILAGHMRVRALKKLGHKGLIDVRVPSRPLTDEERKKYVLISNRVNGDWDFDALANNWDIDLLVDVGFTPEELHLDIDPIIDDDEDKPICDKCESCGQKIKAKRTKKAYD